MLRFGVFELDLHARELRKHGVRIRFTGQPYQVLVALLERPGEVVTREALRQVLWPEQPWGDHDHRLNKVVNKVRESLGDSAEMPRYIETLPRLGYRFLVPVQAVGDAAPPPEPPQTSSKIPAPVEPVPDNAPPVPPKTGIPRDRRLVLIGIASAALLLAGAAAVWAVSGQLFRGRRPVVPAQLAGDSGSALFPAFSPDGKKVAYSWDGADGENFDIYVIETGAGRPRRLTFDPSREHSPAWSPDGREIAFVREIDAVRAAVMVVPADGGLERQVAGIRGGIPGRPVAWAHPRWLVACDQPPEGGPVSLYLVSTENGVRHRLTHPARFGDFSPAVSTDARRLAFTRSTSPGRREIFLLDLSQDLAPAGTPRQITQFRRRIDTLAWTPDGRELIFSAEGPGTGSRYLYRIAASGSGNVRDLADIRVEGTQPSVSPDGRSLAYSRRTAEQFSIWSLEPFSGRKPERLAVSSGKDWSADISADLRRIVFASGRSGPPELWVSAIDGSDLRRAGTPGEAGAHAPRWSPDGRSVVFEARPEEQWDLYIAGADSRIRRLTTDPADDSRPSWSTDGRFIYFCSTRTGRPEIWKMPVSGGQTTQVTHDGGTYALESPDGKTVYYTSSGQPASLRRVAAGGGEEEDVIPGVLGSSGFALSPEGIFYYAFPSRAGSNTINFYSFSARSSRPVVTIEHPVRPVLSLAGGGRRLLYTQIDRRDSEIVLLEDFR